MSGSASSDLYRKKDFGSFNKIGQKLGLINLCKKFSVAQSKLSKLSYLNYLFFARQASSFKNSPLLVNGQSKKL